jgi:hypothetical protein
MSYSFKQAKAAVVEWFDLLSEGDDDGIVDEIEHDRQDYSLRPGLIRKLLVVTDPGSNAQFVAGGTYFFEDFEEAREFLHWASYEHKDARGKIFEERDYVGNRRAHVCEVIAHVERPEMHSIPATVHVEGFRLTDQADRQKVIDAFRELASFLNDAALLSVTCVYDPAENLYFNLSVRARAPEIADDDLPDTHTVEASSLTRALLQATNAERSDLIRFFVFTIWEGRQRDDPLPEAVWPNSPPLPCPAYWNRAVRSNG